MKFSKPPKTRKLKKKDEKRWTVTGLKGHGAVSITKAHIFSESVRKTHKVLGPCKMGWREWALQILSVTHGILDSQKLYLKVTCPCPKGKGKCVHTFFAPKTPDDSLPSPEFGVCVDCIGVQTPKLGDALKWSKLAGLEELEATIFWRLMCSIYMCKMQ